MKKLAILALFWCLIEQLNAQSRVQILDSITHRPIVGANILSFKSKFYTHTDFDGYIQLPSIISILDTFSVSVLSYHHQVFLGTSIPKIIYLSPKKYLLKEATIKPIAPRDYILRAFDSFYRNHAPYAFKQKVFLREEYMVNNAYLRFQEMDMDIFQFPKKNDSRKYYISGSYPKVNNMYRMDDQKQMAEVKSKLGTLVGERLNFNYMNLYSYTKGVNILNFLFTTLLEDKEVTYKYMGSENIKGFQAMHIQGDHFDGTNLKYTSHIYLEENSYAVIHFSMLATDYDISKKYIDFKSKLALWVLGFKFNVKKYYTKIQFQRTKDGFWTVEDYMTMVPMTVKKRKNLLDVVIHISYRMSPEIIKSPQPNGYQLYGENQILFDKYISNPRFGDKLNYSIPLVPIQKDRLGKMLR